MTINEKWINAKQPISGFKRIGVQQITLSPEQTYDKSAEGVESFVLILEGNAELLMDGKTRSLRPLDAIGFPHRPGSSHRILNKTQKSVRLLSFSINSTATEDVSTEKPPIIVNCGELKLSQGWHYPGDNETFSESVRLTNLVGLQLLGVGYDKLSSGRRSCFPHAHTHEEEFCFVISGHGKVWMNGVTYPIEAGMNVAFPPGTGISHCMINDSDEPFTFVTVGEANDHDREKIIYPRHPQRNEQCRRINALWTDLPAVEMGSHNGRPEKGISDHLCLETVTGRDEQTVLSVFQKSPKYFSRVEGCEPTLKSAQVAMVDGPKNRSESYFKEFMLIEHNDKPIGVIDLHKDHPNVGTTYLGLLLIEEDLFGQGIGRKCYGLIEDYIRRSYASQKIKLGVSDDNDVSGFWKKMGYAPNGHSYSFAGENRTTNVIEYEKPLG